MEWQVLYEQAREQRGQGAGGYYNSNIRIDSAAGAFNVRVPLPGADVMDVRLWDEGKVLRFIEGRVSHVPRVRYASEQPDYQIQDFIAGVVLDSVSPRGARVPEHVLGDIVGLMVGLAAIGDGLAPPRPATWPGDRDSAGFGRVLMRLTEDVLHRFVDGYRELYKRLSVPDEPLADVADSWDGLTPRPFRVVHADLHRKNMILEDGQTWFIDWELALWGDPVYEMAVHLHKMDYLAEQEQRVLALWSEAMPAELIAGWEPDLRTHVAHERAKSAVVDTVRYSKEFAAAPTGEARQRLARRLAGKINRARPVWGLPADLSVDETRAALDAFTAG